MRLPAPCPGVLVHKAAHTLLGPSTSVGVEVRVKDRLRLGLRLGLRPGLRLRLGLRPGGGGVGSTITTLRQ